MANLMQIMPQLEGQEMTFVQGLIKDMSDNVAQQFATSYLSQRKDPTTLLILTLLGFIGIAGINRFLTGQIGLGILYLLTGGVCLIGTIVDLIKYKDIAFQANQKIAQQVAVMVRGSN